jgi:SAM-dependent methyltransferase
MINIKNDKQDIINSYSDKKVVALYKNKHGFIKVEKIVLDRFLPKRTSLKILDAGCGSGRTSIELNKMGHMICGVDISYELLKAAKINKDNLSGPHFINSDLSNIPIKDLSFDCIISFYSVLGLIIGDGERKRVIEEFYNRLNKNGLLIFHVHNLLYPGFFGKRWIVFMVYELRNLFSKQKLEFGTRKVNETGQKLFCHYFHLWEIRRLW